MLLVLILKIILIMEKKLFYEGFEVMYFCNIEFLLFCDMLYYLVKNFGKKLNDILVMCNIVFVWL